MLLLNKDECIEWLNIERKVSRLTDIELENPTPKNEKLLNRHLELVERFDDMKINVNDFCRFFNLIK